MADRLTHLDSDGNAHMVDIGSKSATLRTAIAKSRMRLSPPTIATLRGSGGEVRSHKGDVLQVARIAAIQAAKQTHLLIPLCHAIPLESVHVESQWLPDGQLEWTVTVQCHAKTGVEMEAMTAASIAALTTYDMCKAIDRSIEITHVALWQKAGGVRGDYEREPKE
jgi:cyclic pyranopterin phosphate synthase